MTKLFRNKGQGLIVIGLVALAGMAIFLRFHLDFPAGLGLGIGVTTIGFGLYFLKQR
jgi:hypothetical protein